MRDRGERGDDPRSQRDPLTHEGTVRLRGTIVVLGDLIVNGTLIDGWASDSALVVIGNETVRAMEAGSDHIVTGNLRADMLHIVSESTSVACGGTLGARALIAAYWDDGVKPDDLGPLLARLSPRPSEELDASDLTRAFGRGDFALTRGAEVRRRSRGGKRLPAARPTT